MSSLKCLELVFQLWNEQQSQIRELACMDKIITPNAHKRLKSIQNIHLAVIQPLLKVAIVLVREIALESPHLSSLAPRTLEVA